ncbi:hypothetical protein J25TS5_47640 [Paenibacillus faecis]|nr:hypothetical protein J25TS5_47640 [Paenibacillus faecis]
MDDAPLPESYGDLELNLAQGIMKINNVLSKNNKYVLKYMNTLVKLGVG